VPGWDRNNQFAVQCCQGARRDDQPSLRSARPVDPVAAEARSDGTAIRRGSGTPILLGGEMSSVIEVLELFRVCGPKTVVWTPLLFHFRLLFHVARLWNVD
jgi:hypothetical protein